MDSGEKFIHDAYTAMAERTIRRLWILCVVIFMAFVISNAVWIFREKQFEFVSQEVTQETADEGVNNFYGGDYYGEANN